jgi:hypothetical protein
MIKTFILSSDGSVRFPVLPLLPLISRQSRVDRAGSVISREN